MDVIIDKTAKIGLNVTIREGTTIGENVVIEDNVYIDYHCIIRDNVHIKKNSFIGAKSILGEYLVDFYENRKNKIHRLVIGENALIRTENVIYGNTTIGDNIITGHKVNIREDSSIGNNVRVGTLTDIQGRCEIGDFTSIHSNVFICEFTKIKNYVWIFPHVILTNDNTPPSNENQGPILDDFSVIGANSIIFPNILIGEGSLVAAFSLVKENVRKEMLFAGNPGKEICPVKNLINKFTGEQAYPWKYHFERGMPWAGKGYEQWYNSINIDEIIRTK
ncbi:MAG: DapH/DapD/GlmU-related protein [Eubacteriales bacterium]